ncbi:MAG: hypothetical protein M1817_002257 [Caeruleum heppii]|nr:MAG: hypothetical protein M1817_002257 [Caeruleum heppii]
MDNHFIKFFLLALAMMFGFCKAWSIDQNSCTGETREYLRAQIRCAFDAVEAAVQALDPDADGKPEIDRLLGNLMALPPDPSYVSPSQAILARFAGQRPPGRPPGFEFDNNPGILSMRNEVNGNPGTDDVKFYCNTDRFEKLADGRWRDNDLMEIVPDESGNPLKDCGGLTMAYTYVSEDSSKWSTITGYAQEKKWPECGTFGEKIKSMAAGVFDNIVTKYKFTPVDLFSLFDKVIIHELTHTRSAGQTWDSLMDPNGKYELDNLAYGFKNCHAIRDRRTGEGDFEDSELPQNNADTYAIFASGVRIINGGGSVDDEGKITKPTNQKRWPLVAVPFEA